MKIDALAARRAFTALHGEPDEKLELTDWFEAFAYFVDGWAAREAAARRHKKRWLIAGILAGWRGREVEEG